MRDADDTRASVPRRGNSPECIVMPTAYRTNAEKALARYPEQAANYLRHTLIGDPLLDGMPQELADLGVRRGGDQLQPARPRSR